MNEEASERSSVHVIEEGQIRIRTPEGSEFLIPPWRALEWTSDRRFIDRLRAAAMDANLPVALTTKNAE